MAPVGVIGAERFEELVVEGIDALPDWVHAAMDNVSVLIEDRPPPGQPGLLGLYHGIPLSRRGSNYSNVLPDTITLYRATIVVLSTMVFIWLVHQRLRGVHQRPNIARPY